jgi:hypothetical protein
LLILYGVSIYIAKVFNPAQKEEEVWADYGVTPQVAQRFKAYRQAVLSARRSGQMYGLQGSYGNTYWYYYMFRR